MTPDLTSFDWIVVNSSAGKDSQAMLDYVVEQCRAQRVATAKLVVVHSDLGRVEWKGVKELAGLQAAMYAIRFEVVKRDQDLLDHINARGMFPSPQQRYCTSDHKRDQISKLFTRLALESKGLGRQVRILNCMGLRAQESSNRAKLNPYQENKRATSGRRLVIDWLPIHHWTTDQVWARIHESGVPYHYAYDLGMPRLSCCFCIYANEEALTLAGRHNPELLDEYIATEQRIGHLFKDGWSIAQVKGRSLSGQVITISC